MIELNRKTGRNNGSTKRCPKCVAVLPVSAFRFRKKGSPTRMSWCIKCANDSSRERSRNLPRKKQAAPSDDVSRCAACEAWLPKAEFRPFARNKTGCHSYCRACSAAKARASLAEPSRRAALNQRRRELLRERPEIAHAAKARRRARKRQARSDLTAADWLAIVDVFGGRCAYCMRKLFRADMDHVVALGEGPHTADNVVPACRSCNASKGNNTLLQTLLKPHLLVTQRMLGK